MQSAKVQLEFYKHKDNQPMFLRNFILLAGLALMLTSLSCKGALGGLNLFSIEDDKRLGLQVSQEINNSPEDYPILPERGNEEVYRYIRKITNNILNSGKVQHKNDFAWEVKIIDDPNTLNAFCTPGGYIYVYTGLMKYLDTEDQLAGVMGHEIAHADKRHSTRQMTSTYGISTLISMATGKASQGTVEQILTGLTSLKFSRSHESEADKYSVVYLCGTQYNSAGAAGFFKKIESAGGSRTPEFLSTHPNPANRVQNIEKHAAEMSCRTSSTGTTEHNRIKQLLR